MGILAGCGVGRGYFILINFANWQQELLCDSPAINRRAIAQRPIKGLQVGFGGPPGAAPFPSRGMNPPAGRMIWQFLNESYYKNAT